MFNEGFELHVFIRFVWEQQKILGFVVLMALVLLGFFVANFVLELIFYSDPANIDRPVEPWMSMRLVAQSWGLPKEVMIEALGYQPDTAIGTLPRTVAEFLADRRLTIEEFQFLIEETQKGFGDRRGND